MLELLSAILEAANDTFMEQESLSLFPGEYMDGTPAPPDITEVEIEIDRMYTVESGLPGLRVAVTTHEHGGFIAYLQTCDGGQFEDGMTTTLEGYCKQNCDCPMCDAMRSQNHPLMMIEAEIEDTGTYTVPNASPEEMDAAQKAYDAIQWDVA